MKANRITLLAPIFCVLLPLKVLAYATSVQDEWVTVSPAEFQGAINNPLKGFREYKKDGYGLVERQYIKWTDIEVAADDSVERIISHTNKVTHIVTTRSQQINRPLPTVRGTAVCCVRLVWAWRFVYWLAWSFLLGRWRSVCRAQRSMGLNAQVNRSKGSL